MRLPEIEHTSRSWQIHALAPDFRVEDVWELPWGGGPDDFGALVRVIVSQDVSRSSSRAVRALFAIRMRLGEVLGWDSEDTASGIPAESLRERLPASLREAPVPQFSALPFTSLYLLEDEFAAEAANRTMHGVLHIVLVADGTGGYRGQLAVLVKPNGRLGRAYMAVIRPFRHWIVYPHLIAQIDRAWRRHGQTKPARVAAA